MSRYIPVDPEKWCEMVKAVSEVELLKTKVERLTKAHSDALADFWAIHNGYFDLKAEVERLRLQVGTDAIDREHGMCCDSSAENARLKAEVERLRASSFVTAVPVEEYEKLKAERDAAKRCWDSMKEEWDKLVDENIRLRKAGDAMAEEIIGCYRGEGYDPADSETLPMWNAAKEGKPSV